MKILMILFVIAIVSATANAQSKTPSPGGLYLTPADFVKHNLTYEFDGNNAGNRLVLRDFFGSSTGYIISKGQKHAFNKNKVYGYRTCQNKNYRFYNGEAYLLVDTSSFLMYYQSKSEQVNKGKELVKKDEYFFSKNAGADLQPLTVDNLKNTFPDNHRFHYILDANFKYDKDLIAYDKFEKKYKIKSLYNESLKN